MKQINTVKVVANNIEFHFAKGENFNFVYDEAMQSIRGRDVEDILRESPAFNPDCIECMEEM